MRTKTLALAVTLLAVAAVPAARADITLGAPGVPAGSQKATKVPFKNDVTLTDSYKFVFCGIEAKGNTAGAPGSSGTQGNGGQFHVSATVTSGTKVKSDKIEFRDVQDYNTSPLKTVLLTEDVTFRATTTPISINLEWAGEGNAHKPDGIFNILGDYQKAPPIPTGSLNFAVGEWMLQTSGGSQTPEAIVTIVRE
jgi:hypothetical protein